MHRADNALDGSEPDMEEEEAAAATEEERSFSDPEDFEEDIPDEGEDITDEGEDSRHGIRAPDGPSVITLYGTDH